MKWYYGNLPELPTEASTFHDYQLLAMLNRDFALEKEWVRESRIETGMLLIGLDRDIPINLVIIDLAPLVLCLFIIRVRKPKFRLSYARMLIDIGVSTVWTSLPP